MPSLFGFGSSRPSSNDAGTSSKPMQAQDQNEALEHSLNAVINILNDDVDIAEEELQKRSSAYHQLGKGLVGFMRAALGFEKEAMADAGIRLAAAETAANQAQGMIGKGEMSSTTEFYPPGTEYAMCLVEAQVMACAVGLLRESLTEALRGFVKVRRAIQILDGIAAMEAKGAEAWSGDASRAKHEDDSAISASQNTNPQAEQVDEDDDDGFVDAEEGHETQDIAHQYQGRLEINGITTNPSLEESRTPTTIATDSTIHHSHLTTPADQFIHSAYRLHRGILLLILSLIPPSFTKILSIVGFRGDREKGLSLLWQATDPLISPTQEPSKATLMHGSLAALIVSGYYSGLVSTLDILPRDSYPKHRCAALLRTMRAKFPQSRLWILEEARMQATEQNLAEGVRLLESIHTPAQLRQVEALRWFECGLQAMQMHDYAKTEACFLRTIEYNDWSHAFYYYLAGCAHVELYRRARYESAEPDDTLVAEHARKAEDYLRRVPAHTGKRKFVGRQLPFDMFTARKLRKWSRRAQSWGVPLVDAVGVSPIEEIIFFWGGHRRMGEGLLRESLERFYWSDAGARDAPDTQKPERTMRTNPQRDYEERDEVALLAVLRAAVYERLGDVEAAGGLCKTEVIEGHAKGDFKGADKENWVAPAARYQMAVCAWVSGGEGGAEGRTVDAAVRLEKLKECRRWLEEVAAWESYDLDSRFGVKVSTGLETLKKMGITSSKA